MRENCDGEIFCESEVKTEPTEEINSNNVKTEIDEEGQGSNFRISHFFYISFSREFYFFLFFENLDDIPKCGHLKCPHFFWIGHILVPHQNLIGTDFDSRPVRYSM